MSDLRIEMLLSLQRALWEQVTADLRGVAVSCDGSLDEGTITARFLYEGAVGPQQAECVSLAEAYTIADFPPTVTVAFRPVPWSSLDLSPSEEWVYLRREG